VFVIFGCGYTGRRVAERLLGRGDRVLATTRHPIEIQGAEVLRFDAAPDAALDFVPDGARVLYSIPALSPDPAPEIFRRLAGRIDRLVYLSTTSVYGRQQEVDEHTPVAPVSAADRARVAAEEAALGGPWSGTVLRPAAIYGPGRGVHVRMQEGSFRLAGEGLNFVSRIHVDDLAAICDAALRCNLSGAWPVADREPCRSRDIARFCADLLGVDMAPMAAPHELHATRRADRKVDAGALLRALGVELRYPSYRQGIPASVSS
jgi:nucleoside-diphosphate-sugar epimerase